MHAPGLTQHAAHAFPQWPSHPQSQGLVPPPLGDRTRIRWERIIMVLVGIAILAVTGTKVASGLSAQRTQSPVKHVRTARQQAADQATLAPAIPAHASQAAAATPRRVTAPAQVNAHSHASHAQAPASHGASASRGHASHAASALRAAPVRTPSATPARGRVAGGGTAGAGQLPRTGAPVWLAAVIGLLLLLAGLSTHLNAVRIGATAMLYRRGPALRPISTSRALADRLVDLVEAPLPAGDFMTTRVHRGPRH